MENKGKKISEVGERQQCRNLMELQSKIERSVWFAKTFGICLSAVEVKDDANVYHTISFANGNEKQKKGILINSALVKQPITNSQCYQLQ